MENQAITVTLGQVNNFEFNVKSFPRLSATVWLPLQLGSSQGDIKCWC